MASIEMNRKKNPDGRGLPSICRYLNLAFAPTEPILIRNNKRDDDDNTKPCTYTTCTANDADDDDDAKMLSSFSPAVMLEWAPTASYVDVWVC